ncbi:gamma-glutamyltransferase [Novosphingobium flavum]|uniref:Glutathione hydrolase proenzyme n=1 Tax=Novosphingobium flavum TaxID=1778672 RepID=A0A7X1FPJ0_9SPHN|nr:gamma-glutamyltransferase [Novosphingobium flavum]MBC2664580.1 gamma-glutamyltransferase [Novosphingobium flavum]
MNLSRVSRASPVTLALALSVAATSLAVPAQAKAPPAVHVPGMVSAADSRAAEAGIEMLRKGGSATDAALAVMLALNVVEPQSSGIGGGGFLVRGDAKGEVETVDGREFAPAAADGQWFMKDGKPAPFQTFVPGGKSVGVPGALALAATAHGRWGKLPWAALFQPAIKLARDGFLITPRLETMLTRSRRSGTFDADARALYYGKDGEPLPIGTRVKNPALAAMLTRIAKDGPGAFYAGANARALVAEVNNAPAAPSPMTEADLAAYAAPVRQPLCGMYRQWRICGMGPPSSGATTVFAILKQLERFDLTALGPDSPVAWHLIAESMRLAYADRDRWIGDPDFVTVPATGLMDPAYLAARSALIDPAKTLALVSPGTPPGAQTLARATTEGAEEHGTTHFVAVDRAGTAVSYTNTVESVFGSGLMVNGYFLNNELTDFNFAPEQNGKPAANAVAAHKRPRSSMAPSLIYDGEGHLKLAVGAAGGTTIPAQVAKAIIGVLDWHLSARDAIALPVLYAPGNTVFVEKGTAHEAMIPALKALGHADVRAREASFKANAIEVTAGGLLGAADPRSEGAAVTP